MDGFRFAPVAQGLSDFEAKVVTARLGADGILWQVRGVVDGVYPFGNIDVLVPTDELEHARLALDVDAALAGTDDRALDLAAVALGAGNDQPDPEDGEVWHRRSRWYGLALIAALAALSVARVLVGETHPGAPGAGCPVPTDAGVAADRTAATCAP